MTKFSIIKKILFSMIVVGLLIVFAYTPSQAQLPSSYYYTQPLYYPSYGYTNTIDSYLLGFNTYSPFLAPPLASAYTTAGINVYPYLTNPFSTAFPYATLDVYNPYAPVAYPTFTYGDPSLFAYWVNLNL